MKRLFKKVVFGFFDQYFKIRFERCIKKGAATEEVYLVDIDNTLADTWPSLLCNVYRSENHRYRSLSVFMGMRNYIINKISKNKQIVFISARSYLSYFSTSKWLMDNGLSGDELILVSKVENKLYYINELLKKGIPVVYVDDLSYGHEHGETRLYHEVIQQVNKLPIAYLGIKEIALINSGL